MGSIPTKDDIIYYVPCHRMEMSTRCMTTHQIQAAFRWEQECMVGEFFYIHTQTRSS